MSKHQEFEEISLISRVLETSVDEACKEGNSEGAVSDSNKSKKVDKKIIVRLSNRLEQEQRGTWDTNLLVGIAKLTMQVIVWSKVERSWGTKKK